MAREKPGLKISHTPARPQEVAGAQDGWRSTCLPPLLCPVGALLLWPEAGARGGPRSWRGSNPVPQPRKVPGLTCQLKLSSGVVRVCLDCSALEEITTVSDYRELQERKNLSGSLAPGGYKPCCHFAQQLRSEVPAGEDQAHPRASRSRWTHRWPSCQTGRAGPERPPSAS